MLLISGAGWISPEAAKAAGAAGFISKDWSADEVANAVRMVGRGMTVYARQAEGPATPLSPREREVLELIGAGATNREIAERLFLSPHTIKDHTTALYRKLGVRNRAEADPQGRAARPRRRPVALPTCRYFFFFSCLHFWTEVPLFVVPSAKVVVSELTHFFFLQRAPT